MSELGYVYQSRDGRLWSYRECAEAADRGEPGAVTRALNDFLCARERLLNIQQNPPAGIVRTHELPEAK